jgi:glycosyltransferase involved in cell wall biosynthesis
LPLSNNQLSTNATRKTRTNRKMLKILHIIDRLSGSGPTRSMIAVVKYLLRLGSIQQHHVISLKPEAYPLALILAKQARMTVLRQPDQDRILHEMETADIVHVHFWNNPELYELLRSELPPMRLLLWFKVAGDHPPQIINKKLIDISDIALASSPYSSDLPVFEQLPAEERVRKTGMIYGATDFERLAGIEPKPHHTFNVGYIGTVNFTKMHLHYVPMSAEINVSDIRFVVCGGGMEHELRQQAERLGVVERFEFLGYIENIKSVIEILDVFGYPLCEDNYSTAELVLQEVMYAGIPPVIFAYGGAQRTVIHNQTGLIVHSELEYKQAIEYLYHHPEERARLGCQAREYAQQFLGAENAANQMHSIYERLMDWPKRKRRWGAFGSSSLNRAESQKRSGAELFVESLGDAAPQFAVSMTSQSIEELFDAEQRIARSSTLLSAGEGGIFQYRNFYPNDCYLRLWTGLVLYRQGQYHKAIGELQAAINLGCNHWRVNWYVAQAAEKIPDIALAEKTVRAGMQTAPDFTRAQEMLKRLEVLRSV